MSKLKKIIVICFVIVAVIWAFLKFEGSYLFVDSSVVSYTTDGIVQIAFGDID